MAENKCGDCGKSFDSPEALKQHKEAKHTKKEGAETAKKAVDPVKLAIYGMILVIGAIAVYMIAPSVSGSHIGPAGSTHKHVDFMIFIEGVPVDFSKPKYQVASPLMHVEGGIGTLIHKHATGVTFVDFLKTVNMDMNSTCFRPDNGNYRCNGGGKTLKFYLDGKLDASFGNGELRDLQKILVSYGNETEEAIKQQLATITDLAKKE